MIDINPGQLGEAINWKADRALKNLDSTGTGFVIQPGTIIIWPGTTVPDGYLLCDGSEISRTTYAALFAVIGTTYGSGDSSGTFNLPDFQDRVIQGSGTRGNVGTYKAESLPNITGSLYNSGNEFQDVGLDGGVASGAIQIETDSTSRLANQNMEGFDNYNLGWSFDASLSSPTYQDGAPVQPNALLIQCCIKY